MDELKPCPFCGNNPVIVCLSKAYDTNYLSKIFEIACKGCGAKGQNVFRIFAKIEDDGEVICDDGEKQRAINAWNRRAANKQAEETEAQAIRTADDGYRGLYMNAIREIQHAYFHPEDSRECINRILKKFHSLCMEDENYDNT